MRDAPATLSMQDVANLALVRRQAVSMWRRRPRVRGESIPFPKPVALVNGVERFDREEIVAWLESTGRGNNREARTDAPAVSVPDSVDRELLVALLCLSVRTGEQLDRLGHDELVGLAREIDPADEYVVREIAQAEPSFTARRFVDDLVEASFGPADALTRLDGGRLQREAAERGFSDDVIAMMRAVAGACRDFMGQDEVGLVHGGDRALSLSLAQDFEHLIVLGDELGDRAVRRRAVINGVGIDSATSGPGVRVASVVGASLVDALEVIDEVVLELGQHDAAVILGSAAVLCDHLRGDHEQRRAETLRAGHVMMAARLPRGLWRAAHRQALGLWVLHGGRSSQRPRVADLAAVPDELDLEDLASDVVGAIETTDDRAFRYCRLGDLKSILAGGPVVPRGVRAVRIGESSATTHLDRIHDATLVTSTPLEGFDVLVEEAQAAIVLRQRSVGELRDSGQIAMKRGSRIDLGLADPAGTVPVMSADGTWDGVRLDPFDATAHYPRATRTEPGDVVFQARPRPIARVDADGGALVASPSRILRLASTAEVGPFTLATIINELVVEGSEWEEWSVPVLPRADWQYLDDALRKSQVYYAQLQRRVQATHELIGALIAGVAAGVVTLDATPTTTGITTNEGKAD